MTDQHDQLKIDALAFHAEGRPGKLEVTATKPLSTQRDLSLAYSPGVAHPCLEIKENPEAAYEYTAKSNTVAVISNGTAVLGLGNLGALASKPVMEGKAVLFKRFSDIDGLDVEVATEDVDAFCEAVKLIAPSFGGINLEDIKAPESFLIEERLIEDCDIPVMHDDQHGTAIIAAAGMLNALHVTGKTLQEIRLVVNGAGAAALSCVALLKTMGLPSEKAILCDSKGVIHKDRTDLNQWKSAHAVDTPYRTLAEAMVGADAFFGLSVKDAVDESMVESMGPRPIIFAMANPDPEILPEAMKAVRDDAIIATGRSDYPNQVNNVLGFPYIFRGALDVRATRINEEMKVAAAEALAKLARKAVPDEVADAYGRKLSYGPEYIIPAPFDPRLIVAIPRAVAEAAMRSGVARKPIADMASYESELASHLDPSHAAIQALYNRGKGKDLTFVFAEGEEDRAMRAGAELVANGLGKVKIVGRERVIRENAAAAGLSLDDLKIVNAKITPDQNKVYSDYLYNRLKRQGLMQRDVERMVNTDRVIYGAAMIAAGDADIMITGMTRSFRQCLNTLDQALDTQLNQIQFGYSMLMDKGRTVFIGDTIVHDTPTGAELAQIAKQLATVVRDLGHEPRVALCSYSNFGQTPTDRTAAINEAIAILDSEKPDFEYDGEMQVNVALNYDLIERSFPFCRLSGPANILIMPSLDAANIAGKMLEEFSSGTVIGPVLQGFEKPVRIIPLNATVQQITHVAALAAAEV